ncbi:MAG: 50S ribosomal protein L37ae [Candidatus Nanoarchaeia archaeon]|nr:50S ribosomal protein L37ae [Candidatus Haiyanarchaeum thermophilum]MCW1302893.1 50S ribosomal protein L37ae [Candidatus Haiyanarchaeum thermophilum]MCW1303572.1 50S ribosomal protein L37ae [Candidatus Haiyanarchaeum thermophilum]MCW1306254.1 50S ribosomal protein L37ae [Candidatus Haiyanarchaeum thermophilum]MCW1307510.1 50S ribosomal protein L37ae [Candidatus Haiyanarchaeum thermophilum]
MKGRVGSLGARYGLKIRRKLEKIEEILRKKYNCPVCGKRSLRRKVHGIWECKRCGVKIAGGAFSP